MRADELVGKQIGEFTVIDRLGRGGMATVYRAHQPSMHRDVALKVLTLDDALEDESFRQRFAQEAELIAGLEHIHILPVYSYGIQDNIAYLAMRLLRGGSLADLMKTQPLPLERSVDLFSQIAQGLAYAHSKGIVHRDLKPGNIMLDEVGHAYLTDFGLAKLVNAEADMTKTGNVVGTPAYMSPEQLRGEPLDHRSDIYSLGVILYQMTTGKRPFEGDSSDIVSIIYKHLEKMPPRPTSINPALPLEVEAIVMRTLAKQPNDRFANVGEVANALQTSTGIRSTASFPLPLRDVTTTRFTTPSNTTHRRRLMGIVIAALLLLLVVGAGLVLIAMRQADKIPLPTILVDQKGTLMRTVPTDAEIAAAVRVMGADGFIAILPCNQSSEYHATLTREMVEFAREFNLKTRVYNPDSDQYTQVTLLETARADNAHGFILCPLDTSLLVEPLTALDLANMPLVLPANTDQDPSYGGIIISTDNYLLGKLPGQFAGKLIRDELGGTARVVILDYPDLNYLVERADGLEAGLLEFAPNATIIGRYPGAIIANAKESISQLIADGVDFNVIASINDAGSYGAIEALEAAGIDPNSVIIVSVDAETRAQEYIRDGYYLRGSVAVAR
ncbi:MAG: protein kinase, partial [Armatimonadetes bacterium]|nr:protein kinase [Anaerolineae bacterium]